MAPHLRVYRHPVRPRLDHLLRKQIGDQGVPPVPEFLSMLVDSGAKLWACKMPVDMMGLTLEDMHDGVSEIINVAEFLELSEGAQIVFV